MQANSTHYSQMTNSTATTSTTANRSTVKSSYCFSRNPSLSEARRSFLLIIVFDFSFIVLLWLIYCTTRGYSIKDAYENEIVNYNVDISLFDVVVSKLSNHLNYWFNNKFTFYRYFHCYDYCYYQYFMCL